MASNGSSAYDVERAFSRIENELIDSMMRNLKNHKRWETEEGFEWSMWQAEQLKTLEQWRKTNQKKYPAQFTTINQKIEQLLRQNYQDGQFAQEKEILESIQKGFPQVQVITQTTQNVTESLEGAFFKLNDRKLETLIKATTKDLEKAEVAVLRRANDQYRKIIFDAQVYANTGAGTYKKAVDMATKDFLSRGIDCIQYKNGTRHSISNYAEMAIRTAGKRAYLQGEGAKRQEWGISTVIVHKRNGPCPKCLPFVGKVFIDDVWSGGSKDGKSPVTGVKYPLLSTAVAAGLYHPNCKDGHSTYYEGISEPPDSKYSKEELNKLADEYKKEQKEQLAKRQAEKYERLSKYSLDEENQKKYQVRADTWKEQIVENTVEKSSNSDIITSSLIETKEVIIKAKTFANDLLKGIDTIKENDINPFFEYVTRKLGYNKLPQIVSKQTFSLLAQKSPVGIIYRGISGNEAEKFVEEFKTGALFSGTKHAYGHGIYFSPNETLVTATYLKNGQMIKAILSEDARVADWMDILKEYSSTGADKANLSRRRKPEIWEQILSSVGEFAAIKGYDAIAMNGFNGNYHIIVLNRGKVIVEDEKI